MYDALSDLPDDMRDELLEELPDHLAEVVAEEGGSLIDRLGRPEDYAAELRTAAGIEPPAVESDRIYLAEWWITVDQWARDFNSRGARWIGFERVSDLWPALRPGWWVVCAWLVLQVFRHHASEQTWEDLLFPHIGNSRLLGWISLIGLIALSVGFGRQSLVSDVVTLPHRRRRGRAGDLVRLRLRTQRVARE